jgi:hypothetical protein
MGGALQNLHIPKIHGWTFAQAYFDAGADSRIVTVYKNFEIGGTVGHPKRVSDHRAR